MTDQHTQPTCDPRQATTDGLRALADWLDAHPNIPMPRQFEDGAVGRELTIYIGAWDPITESLVDDVPAAFATAVSALGGRRTKDANERTMRVARTFGPGVVLEVWASRDEVCEAVVVGKETVEVEKVIAPAVTETVSEERDIVEWRCAPVLERAAGIADARAALAGAR